MYHNTLNLICWEYLLISPSMVFISYSDPGSISNEFNEARSGEDNNNRRWSIRNWYEQIDKCPPLYTLVIIAGKIVYWILVPLYQSKTHWLPQASERDHCSFPRQFWLLFYNTSMDITTTSILIFFLIILLEWYLIIIFYVIIINKLTIFLIYLGAYCVLQSTSPVID